MMKNKKSFKTFVTLGVLILVFIFLITFGPLLLLSGIILAHKLPQVRPIPLLESSLPKDKFGVPQYRSALFSETHYDPDPYIDTIFAKNFTTEKFSQINNGMTKKQVIDLLGEPLSRDAFGVRDNENPNRIVMAYEQQVSDCWRYSTDGKLGEDGDTSWYSFTVCFEKDLVIGKHVNEFSD